MEHQAAPFKSPLRPGKEKKPELCQCGCKNTTKSMAVSAKMRIFAYAEGRSRQRPPAHTAKTDAAHRHQKYCRPMIESIKELLKKEAEAVLNIPVTDAYEKAVELIVDHVHRRKGKLVTSGMGKAGQIAMNIATTFCSTGIPAVCLHPSEAQHGDLGILQPDDVMLLLSNSGKTTEIVELVSLARNLYPQLKFIVITGNAESPLAHVADICLYTGGAPEVCPLGLTPTTSTTMMTVIGDVLVVNVMLATGFTREQYAMRHHGGYLGRKSRKEEDAV